MPKMDGWKLADLIKATEMGWHDAIAASGKLGKEKISSPCSIVAVTAFTSVTKEEALKHKIDRVCHKPISV